LPNAAQRGDFIPEGRVRANEPALIPDPLAQPADWFAATLSAAIRG
jgi:hypothetical protein